MTSKLELDDQLNAGAIADMRFEHLMSPGRIGALTLPNRVVMPAMDMNLSDGGVISEGDIAHYVTRARGGTGLVTTGASVVAYPAGATSRRQPGLSDDRFIPGLRALADGVHDAGGRVCVQLCHHGKTSAVDTADGRALLVPSVPTAPIDLSPLVDTTDGERRGLAESREGNVDTYKEATEQDIDWVLERFADAAARVRSAGVDAVEIHAAHGYLLSAFLSAGYNQRTDRWGGSIENRARLTCEVIRAVRDGVGSGYPVIVKINGAEFHLDGGLATTEVVTASQLFEAAGADAIHVSGHSHQPFVGFTSGPLPSAIGAYRDVTRAVKAAVTIPVIAVGRMLPELSEEMLAHRECDFVAMGRQLLAEPELVAKIRDGRRASVRPCINCYVCVEQNFFDATPRCAVNPSLQIQGPPELQPTATSRRVVVVGGGPAGMEAARVAAHRGHSVTLLEESDHLGGTAWFSQLTTPANAPYVHWLEHELSVEDVDVRTRTTATVESVDALHPDVVIVATGARRERPAVPGAELPHVWSGDDLRALLIGSNGSIGRHGLRGLFARTVMTTGRRLGVTTKAERVRRLSKTWMPIGRHVVIWGGGLVGLELAEFLAERDRKVTVLEEGPILGLPMAMPRRFAAVQQAIAHGVALFRNAKLTDIRRDVVVYRVGDEERTVRADTVVLAGGVEPDTKFADDLRSAGFDVKVVGDAEDVAYIEGAVHSAWAVAGAL